LFVCLFVFLFLAQNFHIIFKCDYLHSNHLFFIIFVLSISKQYPSRGFQMVNGVLRFTTRISSYHIFFFYKCWPFYFSFTYTNIIISFEVLLLNYHIIILKLLFFYQKNYFFFLFFFLFDWDQIFSLFYSFLIQSNIKYFKEIAIRQIGRLIDW